MFRPWVLVSVFFVLLALAPLARAANLGCVVNLGPVDAGGTIAGVDNGYFGRFAAEAHGSTCRSLDAGVYEMSLEYGRLKRSLRFEVFRHPIQTEFTFKMPSSSENEELFWLVKLE